MLGPSGAGSRVTYRPDWGFLALYQRGKAKSAGAIGDANVTVARAADGIGCAGVEDGGGYHQVGILVLAGDGTGGRGPVAHDQIPCLHTRPGVAYSLRRSDRRIYLH